MAQSNVIEKEASLFAMLLLMPTKFLKEDIDKGLDLTDDNELKKLASKYQVPLTMAAMRVAYYLKNKQ